MTPYNSYQNVDAENYTITFSVLSKGLLGIVGTLLLAWGTWASTALLAHSTSITRNETKLERLPIIEQKLDLLLDERGIHNPDKLPPDKKALQQSWTSTP